jgi:membrane-associated protease RseP (regulator of RpoE activity)
MGAVIKHRGPIPNRKALFDVGISGPLIGLFVSIIVTIIGLLQDPVKQTSDFFNIQLSSPILFEFITRFIPLNKALISYPIAFAGWVGMLVTALNLIPAGQLDGGHVLRAMIGDKAQDVSRIIPFILISLGFYVTYILNRDGFIWVLWGIFLSFFAAAGHPKPLDDDILLGKGRMALGIITFMLGLLCFTMVPFQVG